MSAKDLIRSVVRGESTRTVLSTVGEATPPAVQAMERRKETLLKSAKESGKQGDELKAWLKKNVRDASLLKWAMRELKLEESSASLINSVLNGGDPRELVEKISAYDPRWYADRRVEDHGETHNCDQDYGSYPRGGQDKWPRGSHMSHASQGDASAEVVDYSPSEDEQEAEEFEESSLVARVQGLLHEDESLEEGRTLSEAGPKLIGGPDPKKYGGRYNTSYKLDHDLYQFDDVASAKSFAKDAEKAGFMTKISREAGKPAVILSKESWYSFAP
jgi:hypothetical protein